jgi:RNA polymerase sigma-70 factor (ECF subfamily)
MTRPAAPDPESWAETVITTNADDLLRYFRRRVDEPEDAADLLGRTLLALWENARKVPAADEAARMWCFGIARNLLREHYRSATKRTSIANALRDYLSDSASVGESADTVLDSDLQAQSVRRAVRRLDERSRELVILIHWDGFSIAQAARLLSMNASTARTRYGRALHRLRNELDGLSFANDAGETPLGGGAGQIDRLHARSAGVTDR